MKKSIFLLAAAALLLGPLAFQSNAAPGEKTLRSQASDPVSSKGSSGDGNFEKYDSRHRHDQEQDEENNERDSGSKHFRGHLSGIEIGLNNYTHLRSMTLPPDISYMTADASHSVNLNVNISQVSIGLSRHFGFVAGIGLNWNNYRFENGNSIAEGINETIIPVYFTGTTPEIKRSKFSTLYLNVPVLLECQIPAGYSGHLNLAAGVIGGLKLNAWTKIVYENKEKTRESGDYNLNLLRGGVTARAGYHNFMLYGTYYLTSWFQDLKGPGGYNLEPFEIGIAFTFND
ncbi:MAG: outer membrane beta-barrel protein [Bacteroidales bacterium]